MWNGTMFVDLDWPLNALSLLSASAELLVGAKDDGGVGNNCSCKTCKVPVKMSPPTNQHPVFYRPDALPVTQTSVSKH